jgi:hypothetical protein
MAGPATLRDAFAGDAEPNCVGVVIRRLVLAVVCPHTPRSDAYHVLHALALPDTRNILNLDLLVHFRIDASLDQGVDLLIFE